MPLHTRTLLVLSACLLSVATSSITIADHRGAHPGGRWQVARGGVSLDAAVARIQRETGGRVLSATTVDEGGRAVHRIKVLLPSGKVRVYQVDAGG